MCDTKKRTRIFKEAKKAMKSEVQVLYTYLLERKSIKAEFRVSQIKLDLNLTFVYFNRTIKLSEDSIAKIQKWKFIRFIEIFDKSTGVTSVADIANTFGIYLHEDDKDTKFLTINFLDEFKNEIGEMIHLPKPTIFEDFEALLVTGNFSDVTIHCGNGDELKAHKNILSNRSVVFEKMFQQDTMESKTGIVNCGYDLEIMSAILKYIYSGNFNIEDINTAKEVYRAADYYQLPRLKCLCKSAILTATTSKNVISSLVFADSCGPEADDLKSNILKIVEGNSKEVAEANEVLDFEENVPIHFLNIINSMFKAICNIDIKN